jgi:hypothetical protein
MGQEDTEESFEQFVQKLEGDWRRDEKKDDDMHVALDVLLQVQRVNVHLMVQQVFDHNFGNTFELAKASMALNTLERESQSQPWRLTFRSYIDSTHVEVKLSSAFTRRKCERLVFAATLGTVARLYKEFQEAKGKGDTAAMNKIQERMRKYTGGKEFV